MRLPAHRRTGGWRPGYARAKDGAATARHTGRRRGTGGRGQGADPRPASAPRPDHRTPHTPPDLTRHPPAPPAGSMRCSRAFHRRARRGLFLRPVARFRVHLKFLSARSHPRRSAPTSAKSGLIAMNAPSCDGANETLVQAAKHEVAGTPRAQVGNPSTGPWTRAFISTS